MAVIKCENREAFVKTMSKKFVDPGRNSWGDFILMVLNGFGYDDLEEIPQSGAVLIHVDYMTFGDFLLTIPEDCHKYFTEVEDYDVASVCPCCGDIDQGGHTVMNDVDAVLQIPLLVERLDGEHSHVLVCPMCHTWYEAESGSCLTEEEKKQCDRAWKLYQEGKIEGVHV